MKNFKNYCSVHLTYILFCCSLFFILGRPSHLHFYVVSKDVERYLSFCYFFLLFYGLAGKGKGVR